MLKSQAMKINTGKGSVSLVVLLAIWSVSAIASLPGLAISPILGDLNKVFPKVTDLEIQMLTSLPSLLIIPFVLLSGKLSEGRDKLTILVVGLSIFFLSGVACLFARSMAWLIVISCILGIGAGMVIPLSTGLVVDYFTGDYRVRQLGYSSAINNLTLVIATVVTGYLADVNWHLPFLVYTLPGISLALSFFLKRQRSDPEPEQSIQLRHKRIDRGKLAGLMLFYFFVTYAVLAVAFYASFLIDDYKIDSSFSGVLISLFFLAIMLPGLFIDKIIVRLKQNVNLVSLGLVCAGLLCVLSTNGPSRSAFWAIRTKSSRPCGRSPLRAGTMPTKPPTSWGAATSRRRNMPRAPRSSKSSSRPIPLRRAVCRLIPIWGWLT